MFKVGDKVKRVKCFAQAGRAFWPAFEEGKVYTVTHAHRLGKWIGLKDMPNPSILPYDADNFELVRYTVPAGFKVGDKVVVSEDIGILKAGKVYTVREPYESDIKLGHASTLVYVDGDLRILGGYSPKRFELYKPELTEAQSAGVAGGLQEHSVGDSYPLAAVLYEHGNYRIITIENLQTGEVAAIDERPTKCESFEQAYALIEGISKGDSWFKTKGRVHFVDGRWVVSEPATPVRVTRLRNMLHHPNTNSSGS